MRIGDQVWVAGQYYTVMRCTKRTTTIHTWDGPMIFTLRRDGSWRVKGGSVRMFEGEKR